MIASSKNFTKLIQLKVYLTRVDEAGAQVIQQAFSNLQVLYKGGSLKPFEYIKKVKLGYEIKGKGGILL